jgi:hypothetical protein
VAVLIPVATLTTPVPAVAPVYNPTLGWVTVKVLSLPITVAVCLSKLTPVTISVKSIWVSPSFYQVLFPTGPTGTYSEYTSGALLPYFIR